MSSFSRIELERQLKEAGAKLLICTETDTQVQELLQVLDQVHGFLSKVEQAPSTSMQDALYPSMKALISNQLLRHSNIDVKVSVASCTSELTRITAPEAPYDDDYMKEIFQLTLMALENLSNKNSCGYAKALHILDNMANVRSCLLMLDLEYDQLIVDMFQQFLSTIRDDHPIAVFRQMEYIMTLTLVESEEISHELLHVLLTSVNKRKEDQNVFSLCWRLGEKVLKNCAVELQRFLPDVVRSRKLDFGDYSDIVASICQNSPREQHEVTERTDPSAREPSDSEMNDGIGAEKVNGILREQNSLQKLENCCLGKQQKSIGAEGHTQPNNSDITGTVQATVVKIPKKRGRKPKSILKSEEPYHSSAIGERRESFKEPLCPKNNEKKLGSCVSKQSSSGHEDRETNSSIVSSRPVHERDSTMPHGSREYGEELVGRRVKVWWPADRAYYEGAVASFDPIKKKHTVLYADGDIELLNMSNELWKLEEPIMEQHTGISSPSALSPKSRKKNINTKSESCANQGIPSSSKRRRFDDQSIPKASNSGKCVNDLAPSNVPDADITDDDTNKVDSNVKDTSLADDSKPVGLHSAERAKCNIAANPKQMDGTRKFNGEEETEKLSTITKPTPLTSVAFDVQNAIHTTGEEKDKSSHGERTEDTEKGTLADSVDVRNTISVKKRGRPPKRQGFTPQHGLKPKSA